MKIRSDDPLAMKTFIVSIHNKANEIKTSPDSQGKIKNYTVSYLREIRFLKKINVFLLILTSFLKLDFADGKDA